MSVKRFIPDSKIILILADKIPLGFLQEAEPFDEVITIDNLGIPVENLNLWIYMHSVVELCTAVKGQALYNLLEKYEKVVYLDPDIVLFNDLQILTNLLDQYDIIFTPHQTVPEENDRDIVYNEICSLQHGIYNFGFFAVKSNANGKSYAKWYRDRLLNYCKDDISNGLFTDQRWGDIAPAFFDNLYIWKDPGANVCTWNLTHRLVSKDNNTYYVNGKALLFYHFSGFDSGAQLGMLDMYSNGNPVLYELRNWYIDEINKNGQKECEKNICFYNLYLDGTVVNREERILLRNRLDLQDHFSGTNPYDKEGSSYYSWYINERKVLQEPNQTTQDLLNELNSVYNSKSWRITAPLRKIFKFLRFFKNQNNLNMNRNNYKKNILVLAHLWGDKAGTSIHISDIINEMKKKYNFYVLVPYYNIYQLFRYQDNGEESIEFFPQSSQNFINRFANLEYLYMLENIVDNFNIDIIHIHHMLGHFFNITKLIKKKRIKLIISLHDLYAICPRINKINYENVYCGYPDENECNICLKSCNICIFGIPEEKSIIDWKYNWNLLFSLADKVIVPSESTRDEVLYRYKNLSVDVIEHGIDINKQKDVLDIDDDKVFNVAFIGTITEIKGKKIIEDLINYSQNFNDNIYFHLFGFFYNGSYISERKYGNFIEHGEYHRNNLKKLFIDNNIKLVCIFSVCPETYCYTLSESIANNVPILAIDIGAVGQRVKENNWGWLIKNGNDISEIYKVIVKIFNEKTEYKLISKIVASSKIKSVREMSDDYNKIYSSFKVKKNWFLLRMKKIFKTNKDCSFKYKNILDYSLTDNLQVHDIVIERTYNGEYVFNCGKNDPQILIPLREQLIKPKGNCFVIMKYTSTIAGNLSVYYNYANGLNEETCVRQYIRCTNEKIATFIPITGWKSEFNLIAIRIDPPNKTSFSFKDMQIVEYKY